MIQLIRTSDEAFLDRVIFFIISRELFAFEDPAHNVCIDH
jgi:hypothetical protein